MSAPANLPPAAELLREKQELDAVLASGIFNRAPNLARLLSYICAKYFEGSAADIKEYNLAVDALGRPPEFDQKTDAIVRVEAHRLRKRLREYYEGAGADHDVSIEIPSGQYAPRFVHREPHPEPVVETPSDETLVTIPAEVSRPLVTVPRKYSLNRLLWVGIPAVLIVVSMLFIYRARAKRLPPPSDPPPAAIAQQTDGLRILCGLDRGTYIDHFGIVWTGDRYFQGGDIFEAKDHALLGTRDPRLYSTRREGSFRYDIPLQQGVYELHLHFAETVYGAGNPAGGGESSRVFDVLVNGREALHQFDIIADAGASTADVKVFTDISPATDGKLHLQFVPHSNPAILSAIEIIPGIAGKMRPIRMIAQDRRYTDKNGQIWEPDRFAMSGNLVLRNFDVSNTPEPYILRGERFGNLTYPIPVADGTYTVTLYFAETWFGPGNPGGGGPGSRVFDILCNGVAVRRNFDIYKEAGGADRAVTFAIRKVVASHQGKIILSLVPVVNYATINAIEVE